MNRIDFVEPYTSLEQMHNICADLETRLANDNGDENAGALRTSYAEHLAAYNTARVAFGLSPIAAQNEPVSETRLSE